MEILLKQTTTDVGFQISLSDRSIVFNFLLEKLIGQQSCKESLKDIHSEFKIFLRQNNVKTRIKKSQFRFVLSQLLEKEDILKCNVSIVEEKAGFYVHGVGLKSVRFEESLLILKKLSLEKSFDENL